MNALLALTFALIAAIGNALFALGQRRAAGAHNGLSFVAVTALITTILSLLFARLLGPIGLGTLVRENGRALLLAGGGSFITFLGLNLLFSRFGVSPYVLYAMLAILTTTHGLGILYLHEPINGYKLASILLALISVLLYSFGSARS